MAAFPSDARCSGDGENTAALLHCFRHAVFFCQPRFVNGECIGGMLSGSRSELKSLVFFTTHTGLKNHQPAFPAQVDIPSFAIWSSSAALEKLLLFFAATPGAAESSALRLQLSGWSPSLVFRWQTSTSPRYFVLPYRLATESGSFFPKKLQLLLFSVGSAKLSWLMERTSRDSSALPPSWALVVSP